MRVKVVGSPGDILAGRCEWVGVVSEQSESGELVIVESHLGSCSADQLQVLSSLEAYCSEDLG